MHISWNEKCLSSMANSFIHLFTKYLPCVRHCPRHGRCCREQDRHWPCSYITHSSVGAGGGQRVNKHWSFQIGMNAMKEIEQEAVLESVLWDEEGKCSWEGVINEDSSEEVPMELRPEWPEGSSCGRSGAGVSQAERAARAKALR